MRTRILVIEDNEKNLKLVRDVLEYAGYEVVLAKTGEDGIEALRQLRETGQTAVPVVAVTAFAMRDDRRRVLDAGFDGYLEKPISVRDFPGQIRAFLNREVAT